MILSFALILIMALGTLSAQSDKLISSFEIDPNPMDRYTRISVHVEDTVEMQIIIQNSRGRLVKSLFAGQVDKEVIVYWNRRSDEGTIVPAGEYEVVVSYGGRYTSVKKTLILR